MTTSSVNRESCNSIAFSERGHAKKDRLGVTNEPPFRPFPSQAEKILVGTRCKPNFPQVTENKGLRLILLGTLRGVWRGSNDF